MHEKNFKSWLIKKGYKQFTPKGYPSTLSDYASRIRYIIWYEKLSSWQDVADNIEKFVIEYDKDGIKSLICKKSHNAVISALKRFNEYLIDKK